jgi:hypothetical protein
MGHWYPNRSPAARKSVAAEASPASRPQINLISPQMKPLQRILNSNRVHGLPPKQPAHNSRLRAGLLGLCKYNLDRKDYSNQETKMKQNESKQNNLKRRDGHNALSPTMKDEILVKPTMATPTNNLIKPTTNLIKPTEITRKKPDENARIKFSKVEPVPPAPFVS